MRMAGAFEVAAPRAAVWDAIRDPAVMAGCIPGCESAERVSDDAYRAVIAVKVGPIAARFTILVEVEEEIEPRLLRTRSRGEEGSRASAVNSANILKLSEPAPGRTEVAWSAEAAVTGRLGKYGLGVMRKKAEALSARFVEDFRARVEADAGAAAP